MLRIAIEPLYSIIKGKDTVNSGYVHEIKNRKHARDPAKEVTGTRILVFNIDGYCSEKAIDDKEVDHADAEAFEKAWPGLKEAPAEDQQVHEEYIWDDHV
jgi:hypothetical protein